MPLIPFNFYLEYKLNSRKSKANFNKEAFEEKCKNEWNNMANDKKIFWIKYALEQDQGKIINNKNSTIQPGSFRINLVKNHKPLHKVMAVDEPEKLSNVPYRYYLFRRSMLSNEEVMRMQPKERSAYIAQCWECCKPAEQKNILPELTSDKKLDKKTKGISNKQKSYIKNLKTAMANEEADVLLNGPEIPPACAFYLFMKNYYDLYPYSNDALYVWRKLSAEDREVYVNILEDMRVQYAVDCKNFREGYNFDQIEKYILNANKIKGNIYCDYFNQAYDDPGMIQPEN